MQPVWDSPILQPRFQPMGMEAVLCLRPTICKTGSVHLCCSLLPFASMGSSLLHKERQEILVLTVPISTAFPKTRSVCYCSSHNGSEAQHNNSRVLQQRFACKIGYRREPLHKLAYKTVTCWSLSCGWFPMATLAIPGRSISVRSGTSGDQISREISSPLVLPLGLATIPWAARWKEESNEYRLQTLHRRVGEVEI